MSTPVIMPRQGQSVESCIIGKWHKQPGDTVEVGELLFSYETDKAAFDEESQVSGVMLGRFFEEGDDVPCLLNVCVIGAPGEEFESFRPSEAGDVPAAPAAPPAPVEAPAAPAAPLAAQPAPVQTGDIKVSPRARQMAEREGVDLRYATPTGPNGRVIERDVETLRASGVMATPSAMAAGVIAEQGSGVSGRVTTADVAAPAPVAQAAVTAPTVAPKPAPIPDGVAYIDEKLPGIRKAIAKNMQQSLNNTAQLTHHLSFDATDIMAFRARLKQEAEALGLPNITLNDIVLFAVSRTLKDHRALNAHYMDDFMRYFSDVNLGMAVDTDRGLMVPTLFGADKLSLADISIQARALAKAAQSGSLSPDLMTGATFTISNLGALDIEIFTPVLNPPQTGILGVCTITQRVREVNGKMEMYPAMGLSLTYDHRALDGAPASRFLKDLKHNLEHFGIMLAKG